LSSDIDENKVHFSLRAKLNQCRNPVVLLEPHTQMVFQSQLGLFYGVLSLCDCLYSSITLWELCLWSLTVLPVTIMGTENKVKRSKGFV